MRAVPSPITNIMTVLTSNGKELDIKRTLRPSNRAMEKVTEGLEGTFVKNPMWTAALGKSVVSAHPLGGCPMGESGRTGVVNHAGQVFEGKQHKLYLKIKSYLANN